MAHKAIRGLYKRGRIWWYCIQPEGEPKPIRKSTGQTKRDDAQDFLDAIRREIHTANYIPTDHRTQEILNPLEIDCSRQLQDRERRGKLTDSYRKLAGWTEAFQGRDLKAVNLEDVEGQLAKSKDTLEWSNATYNNALACVSGV